MPKQKDIEKQTKALTDIEQTESAKRMEALVPRAHMILDIIASANLPLGNTKEEDEQKFYDVAEKVLVYLLQENIYYNQKVLVFQLAMQALDKVGDIVNESLKKSFSTSIEKVFDKDELDIALSDINDIITSRQTTVDPESTD